MERLQYMRIAWKKGLATICWWVGVLTFSGEIPLSTCLGQKGPTSVSSSCCFLINYGYSKCLHYVHPNHYWTTFSFSVLHATCLLNVLHHFKCIDCEIREWFSWCIPIRELLYWHGEKTWSVNLSHCFLAICMCCLMTTVNCYGSVTVPLTPVMSFMARLCIPANTRSKQRS